MATVAETHLRYVEDEKAFLKSADCAQGWANTFREHADRLHLMMTLVKELRPASILDVGCNKGLMGSLFRWRREYAPELIVGVEWCETSAMYAERVNEYDKVHVLDAGQPFDLGRKFDLVICTELLEHVPDPQIVVDNCAKHAAKHAIFSVPEEHAVLDGVLHVRHVSFSQLKVLINTRFSLSRAWFLENQFGEKPRWQGWNFVLGEV